MNIQKNGSIAGLSRFCAAAVALAAGYALAGSAEQVGSDYVVSAEQGETYQINSAIGNYSRLVKIGDGEVLLNASSSAFSGSVVVSNGTLSISRHDALGASSPVTVESGATFHLKTPHKAGNQDVLFSEHKVTISGDGVDGLGAIRYTPSDGNDLDDNLLGDVELLADATVECVDRWGVRGVLTLNGHKLRVKNLSPNRQWMINRATVNGPGVVEAYCDAQDNNGTITLQGNVASSPDVTYVATNSNSKIYIYEVNTEIPSAFTLFPGGNLSVAHGTNHITGPIRLPKNAGSSDGYVSFGATWPNAMFLDGPITDDEGVERKSGTAFNTYSDRTESEGSLYLNGDVSVCRDVYVNQGVLFAMTSAATRVYAGNFQMNHGSRALIGGGNTFVNRLLVGVDSQQGKLELTGGVFEAGRSTVGGGNGSVGHWVMTGGEARITNDFWIAENGESSFGSFIQTGGTFNMQANTLCLGQSGKDSSQVVHYGGTAVFHVSGGTNDTRCALNGMNPRFKIGELGGVFDVTVSGEGTVQANETVRFCGSSKTSTNVFNVTDGATFKATRFFKHRSAVAGSFVNVNADGGTMMPTLGNDWTGVGPASADFYKGNPDHFVVWKKGLVIDTSEITGNHRTSMIPFAFESPSGKGVEAVELPAGENYTTNSYHGLARVVFEDETGWGASAYAEYDFATKRHSRVVVTSRGCNYSDNAKAYVESPGRTERYECALTLSDNAGLAGELVKRGETPVYLYATNSIAGGIAVESGTLCAWSDGVVPSNTPVRVEHGATLQFTNPGPLFLSSFTGAGSVPDCDITVTDSLRATCEDLFAGKYAAFSGTLTFAPGATFTITDPENLTQYEHNRPVLAFTAFQVNGTPILAFEGTPARASRWRLVKQSNAAYRFGPYTGTTLRIR